jgi:hypothetical protein
MSKTTTISSQSNATLVTNTANTANVSSRIFRLVVPRGAVYDLLNRTLVKGNPVKGALFILDLNRADGQRISGASQVKIRVRNPAQEDPKTLRVLPYSIWRDITSVQQRNDDYKATLASATDLDTAAVRLGEFRELIIEVDGPDVVDWTKSYLQFDVEEFN